MDRYRRARLVLCAAAVMLFAGQYSPGYAGTTVPETLTWTCGKPPLLPYGGQRWIGELPVHGQLEATPSPDIPPAVLAEPVNQAAGGRLHFVSANKAVFTSDQGGWFVMRALPANWFMNASCSLGSWPPPSGVANG
ncbi:MAG TPA: hypothetical protein VFA83_18375 [Acidimicrobiales bacterium]|nr:hypothetical protein [Acidimicrobiales bacterium]